MPLLRKGRIGEDDIRVICAAVAVQAVACGDFGVETMHEHPHPCQATGRIVDVLPDKRDRFVRVRRTGGEKQ
jgi:3',5'-cyclic AMP phosphodiesterase CpdA